MTTAPIVVLDTETTGLDRAMDEIWEFAAIRRNPDGFETQWHVFVEHDLDKAAKLPAEFRADHDLRYDPDSALRVPEFLNLIRAVFAVPDGTPYDLRPHVVGAVPDFDLAILARYGGWYGNAPWHHHIQDVENLAIGYLRGLAAHGHSSITCGESGVPCPEDELQGPPWDSEALSRAVGVDPESYARHTALGDTLWAAAIFDRVVGRAKVCGGAW